MANAITAPVVNWWVQVWYTDASPSSVVVYAVRRACAVCARRVRPVGRVNVVILKRGGGQCAGRDVQWWRRRQRSRRARPTGRGRGGWGVAVRISISPPSTPTADRSTGPDPMGVHPSSRCFYAAHKYSAAVWAAATALMCAGPSLIFSVPRPPTTTRRHHRSPSSRNRSHPAPTHSPRHVHRPPIKRRLGANTTQPLYYYYNMY